MHNGSAFWELTPKTDNRVKITYDTRIIDNKGTVILRSPRDTLLMGEQELDFIVIDTP